MGIWRPEGQIAKQAVGGVEGVEAAAGLLGRTAQSGGRPCGFRRNSPAGGVTVKSVAGVWPFKVGATIHAW